MKVECFLTAFGTETAVISNTITGGTGTAGTATTDVIATITTIGTNFN
jgi:hypothetical protein